MPNLGAPLADPPIGWRGCCAMCKGPRRFAELARMYQAAAAADPFCSSECCRRWHEKHADRT